MGSFLIFEIVSVRIMIHIHLSTLNQRLLFLIVRFENKGAISLDKWRTSSRWIFADRAPTEGVLYYSSPSIQKLTTPLQPSQVTHNHNHNHNHGNHPHRPIRGTKLRHPPPPSSQRPSKPNTKKSQFKSSIEPSAIEDVHTSRPPQEVYESC